MEHILDHQRRAEDRLIEQYRSRESYRRIVQMMTAEHQVLEDELQALYEQDLDRATGPYLDLWGRLANQPRGGLDDDSYRIWIKARLLILRRGGDIDTLIQVMRLVILGATDVRVIEEVPAAFRLALGGGMPMIASAAGPIPITDVPALIPSLIRQAKAAGVRAIFQYNPAPADEVFRLDIGPGLDVGVLSDSVQVSDRAIALGEVLWDRPDFFLVPSVSPVDARTVHLSIQMLSAPDLDEELDGDVQDVVLEIVDGAIAGSSAPVYFASNGSKRRLAGNVSAGVLELDVQFTFDPNDHAARTFGIQVYPAAHPSIFWRVGTAVTAGPY